MKTTAVEWLLKILEGQKDKLFNYEEWLIAFNHAKEMEKQQIIDAYRNGGSNQQSARSSIFHIRTEEQYYNETFKK